MVEPTVDLATLRKWSHENLGDFARYAYLAYGESRHWDPEPNWDAVADQIKMAWAAAADAAIEAHWRSQAACRVMGAFEEETHK